MFETMNIVFKAKENTAVFDTWLVDGNPFRYGLIQQNANPVGLYGIFVNVFVVVFPGLFLRGRNGFRDGERFGTSVRNGFLGCAKVHEFWFSDCGYYMVLYHAVLKL